MDELKKLIESIDTDKVLTDEQKAELASYSESIVTKLNEEREAGYKSGFEESKRIAEEYCSEYEDSVDTAIKEMLEATDTLIEKRVLKAESQVDLSEVVDKVDQYLNVYVKEAMPEALVVDYKKLQRLEKTVESIKESVLLSEDEIHAKAEKVAESVSSESKELNENLATKDEQLQAEMTKRITLESELNQLKAEKLLNEKVSELPELESGKLVEKFKTSTVEEIEESFETEYENIRHGVVTEKEDIEHGEIKSIIAEALVDEDEDDIDPVRESSVAHYAKYVK